MSKVFDATTSAVINAIAPALSERIPTATATNLQEIGQYTSHDTIYYNFLCITNWDKSAITLQDGETISYKWISENDFIDFVNSDQIIDSQRVHYHDFLVKMGYIK